MFVVAVSVVARNYNYAFPRDLQLAHFLAVLPLIIHSLVSTLLLPTLCVPDLEAGDVDLGDCWTLPDTCKVNG